MEPVIKDTVKMLCALGLTVAGMYGMYLHIDGAGWVLAVGLITVASLFDFA